MKDNSLQSLELQPISKIPDINPGDDIADLICGALQVQDISIGNGDVIVITQKIISKAENRYIHLSTLKPSRRAKIISRKTNKSPQLVELILRESNEILRYNKQVIIVEHKLGFICANAGIDQSNIGCDFIKDDQWYLMLPENPDRSAAIIREILEKKFDVSIGVLIIDSHGRAWRYGTVGISIGMSGLPGLVDLRGKPDLYGRTLKITRIGAADELAAGASLVMGQSVEHIPVVIARGFPYALRDAPLNELLRDPERDLFR